MTAVPRKVVGGDSSRRKSRSPQCVCSAASFVLCVFLNLLPLIVTSSTSEANSTSIPALPLNIPLNMSESKEIPRLSPTDPNSYSRPDVVSVSDIHLHLNVDFELKKLIGYVDLTLQKHAASSEVILDVNGLDIKDVRVSPCGDNLNYTIAAPIDAFGSKMTVTLPSDFASGLIIRINYETSPTSTALQWLSPNQTAGRNHPYLFSQCEAILARGMLPCQDSPSVKSKYTASITAPSELTVLMSAQRDGEPSTTEKGLRTHRFKQPIPIPSYLFAIAIGALEWREIGPRSRVWSEKEFVDQAAYEFAETESFLKTAEQLCGPYVWGTYDLLVLPPSFPFGGMENPCLTFVTPTILAGDRSLANVVAHEISHSWTGNLVTNANFEHFWLNEGWTVFMERKILGRLQGEQARQFDAIGGLKELEETITSMGSKNPLTALVPDLQGVDPEDSFSNVPYEKGHTFLFFLEQLVGGPEAFEPFAKAYINTFKLKSITTDQFKKFLLDSFPNKTEELNGVDWESWLHTPGMPPVIPHYDDTYSKACESLAKRWQNFSGEEEPHFPISEWQALNVAQKIEVLALLLIGPQLSEKQVTTLGTTYGLDKSRNNEIRVRWLRIGLRARLDNFIDSCLEFVTNHGRMKYLRPVYRDLYQWEAARPRAIATFNANKRYMMALSVNAVAKELHLIA